MTCNCDIHSLMRGEGHAAACPEFGPPTQWGYYPLTVKKPSVVGETIKSTLGTFMFSGAPAFAFPGTPVEGDEITILEPTERPLEYLLGSLRPAPPASPRDTFAVPDEVNEAIDEADKAREGPEGYFMRRDSIESLVGRFTVSLPDGVKMVPISEAIPGHDDEPPNRGSFHMKTVRYCPAGHEIKDEKNDDCTHRCGSRYKP